MSRIGNQMTTRGRAKRLKGVGTKVTGVTRREFRPNLQSVRITTENGTNKTVRVCAQCLRCGSVTKRVRAKPFASAAK
jgi:large subunit ribosomal protein L28